ncbi:MAG: class I SAM-dependent methyltransferase [Armatimonadetes bacterium]|nr:class I SAM-dependent methyltransferase [Armatimonadota bacterium]
MAAWDEVMAEVEQACRERGVPMLGREKAEVLARLVAERQPKLVVECGTAIGYSGLWITRQLRENGRGRLITLELDPQRAEEARVNFERAGVADLVEQQVGDAKETIRQVKGEVDFLLLDNNYENYLPCFLGIRDRLVDGARIVADNVGIGEGEMKEYLDLVRREYPSETVWFDVDLPWLTRDAMEVTVYRK